MKEKYLLTYKLNLQTFTMGALLKIYTYIFVQFLSNVSCGKTVWMRLKASPALKGLILIKICVVGMEMIFTIRISNNLSAGSKVKCKKVEGQWQIPGAQQSK